MKSKLAVFISLTSILWCSISAVLRGVEDTPASDASGASVEIDPIIKTFIESALSNVDPFKVWKTFGSQQSPHQNHAIGSLDFSGSSNSAGGVDSGFISMRYRPNGDCSGPIIIENGMALGCVSGMGQIMKVSCRHNGASGYLNYSSVEYDNAQCSGQPMAESMNSQHSSFPKCSFQQSSVENYGHRTQGVQCIKDTDYLNENAGLLISMHIGDKKCRPKTAAMYSLLRKGTCFMDNQGSIIGSIGGGGGGGGGNNRRNLKESDLPPVYTYIRLDECRPDGTVTVGRYTDPSCTRLFSSINSNLTQSGAMAVNHCQSMMSVIFATATCKQDNKRDNPKIQPYTGPDPTLPPLSPQE